jgi:hypothetical protein
MSEYLDHMFVGRMSFSIPRFKWIKGNVARCRCPYCGDSKKSTVKARGYFFVNEKKDGYTFSCKNCGVSRSVYGFLEDHDQVLWKEYIVERLRERSSSDRPAAKKVVAPAQAGFMAKMVEAVMPYSDPLGGLPRLSELPADHPAVEYMVARCFTPPMLERLFYAADFNVVSMQIDKTLKEEQIPHDKRIIIPFYHADGKLKCIQGRAMDPRAMRYITVKTNDDVDKIFGLERLDPNRVQLVFEGPLDSMFFPNAVGTCDSALTKYDSDKAIYVWDNQPRNIDIVKKVEKAVAEGRKVVIWGEDCPFIGKDPNDMIKNGASTREILAWIASHAYNGLRANLALSKWRKL